MTQVLHYATQTTYASGTEDKSFGYSYDHQNRWIGKTRDTDADGTVDESSAFVYDNSQIALQFDKTGAADMVAADLSHRYGWGTPVDQLLWDEQVTTPSTAGTVLWSLTDNLGSVRDVIDNLGVVKIHRYYNAFGKMTETISNATLSFAYTARPLDLDSGLQNHLNRWYDTIVARWTGPDPIGFEGGDENLYRYVGNRPTVYSDPTGTSVYPPIPIPRPRTLQSYHDQLADVQEEWERLGHKFAAKLMDMFLNRSGNATDPPLEGFDDVIKSNSEYQEGLNLHIWDLIKGGLAYGDLDDRNPESNKAFAVEFAGLGDFNFFSTSYNTGTDLTWALGTGHFGYENASLRIVKTTKSSVDGWLTDTHECIYELKFQATMIQRDSYAFPRSRFRETAYDYHAGAVLQASGRYPAVLHVEEWKEERTYFLHSKDIFLFGNLGARYHTILKDADGNIIGEDSDDGR